jgi:plastocyanin
MRVRAVTFVIAMAAVGCGGDGASDEPDRESGSTEVAAQEFTILVDAPTTDDEGLAYTQFFPGTFQVHPGDSISFESEGTMNPHSITFGAEADRSNLPLLLLPDGSENPAVNVPCFSDEPPTPELSECPQTAATALDFPAYDGTGYWSSGIAEGTPVVQLDPAIAPGSYPFHCTIHLGMSGTMEVVPADAAITVPDAVLEAGRAAQAAAVEAGEANTRVPEPTGEIVGASVVAGWDSPTLNVNRFEPEEVTIGAGDSVTWSVEAWYGHDVVFADLVGGEVIDSGLIWGPGIEDGVQTFTLEFSDPGTYDFVCSYHSSMTGSVTVT